MDWNADVDNLNEQMKEKLEDEAAELVKLIDALDIGKDVDGESLLKLNVSKYVNMIRENDFEASYTMEEIVEFSKQDLHF